MLAKRMLPVFLALLAYAGAAYIATDVSQAETTVLELGMGEIEVKGVIYAPRLRVTSPGGPQYRVINGQQCLYISKDDPAYRVTLVNNMNQPTSMHPHGLTGPMDTDGVAFITQTPIYPGRAQRYDFPLAARDMGTYFLHSHYGLQHPEGLSIPLIVEGIVPTGYPNADRISTAMDAVMFLEDFCLHALESNPGELGDNPYCNDTMSIDRKMAQIWDSMKDDFPMDTCQGPIYDDDVAARHHLVNEKPLSDSPYVRCEPGQAVRLRVISSTSFAFYLLDFGGLNATVITADGKWIQPRDLSIVTSDSDARANTIWIAPAQRYDVLVDAPMTPGVYLIRAIVQVAEGSPEKQQTGIILVVGADTPVPPPGTYQDTHDDPGYIFMMGDPELHAWFPLPPRKVDRELAFNITGDNGFRGISGYSWLRPPMIPEPYVPNPYPLQVKAGERVCITMNNFNPWAHPMHLHGHAFQVVSVTSGSLGINPPSNSPVRDTVQTTKGCGTTRVCFDAFNPGNWLIHCHKDLHAVEGMATSVEYLTGIPDAATLANGPMYDPIDAAFPQWGVSPLVANSIQNESAILVSRTTWGSLLAAPAIQGDGDDGSTASFSSTTSSSSSSNANFALAVGIAASVSFCVGVCLAIAVSRRNSETGYKHHALPDNDNSTATATTLEMFGTERQQDGKNLKCLLVGVLVIVILATLIVVIIAAGKGVTGNDGSTTASGVDFLQGNGKGTATAKTWIAYSPSERKQIVLDSTGSTIAAGAVSGIQVTDATTDTQFVTAIRDALSALSLSSLLSALGAIDDSHGWTTLPSTQDLNTYQQRFGFPFILRAGDAKSKLAVRIQNSVPTELAVASREFASVVSSVLISRLAALASGDATVVTTPAVLITTHVLDTTRGLAAQGVRVLLQQQLKGGNGVVIMGWSTVASATTNADGRASFGHAQPPVTPGVYRVVFGIREYFASYDLETIYPEVTIPFIVRDGNAHYHIPISAAPFAFQTYRGS